MAKSTHRLFVAIPLEQELKEYLNSFQQGLANQTQNIRWVQPDKLHVTLLFLGNQHQANVPLITSRLPEFVANIRAFEMTVCGFGAFPGSGPVSIIWAGISKGQESVQALATWAQSALNEFLDKPETRPYSPHITLGRCKKSPQPASIRKLIAELPSKPRSQMVKSICLFESRPSASGTEYICLAEQELS